MENVKPVIGEYPFAVAFNSPFNAWQTTMLIDANQSINTAERVHIADERPAVRMLEPILGSASASRQAKEYTVRIISRRTEAAVPAEFPYR
jgi:hypothetical protein